MHINFLKLQISVSMISPTRFSNKSPSTGRCNYKEIYGDLSLKLVGQLMLKDNLFYTIYFDIQRTVHRDIFL